MLSRPKSGFSLVEAVISAFLLLTAIALSVYVFDSSLKVEASNEQRVLAAIVADSALAEARAAANVDFGNMKSTFNGRNWILADYPAFQIDCTVTDASLAVPCTELESQYPSTASFPAVSGRYLNESAAKVQMDVSWGSSPSQSISVYEYITSLKPVNNFVVQLILPSGAPAVPTSVVNIARGGGSSDGEIFSARARIGASGPILDDVQFTWIVEPLTGFGSIRRVSRNGDRCQYVHAYRNYRNYIKYSDGACRLVLKASYQGHDGEAKVRINNVP